MTEDLASLAHRVAISPLLQRHTRFRVKEVNRLARGTECQSLPDGQRRASVDNGHEFMVSGGEVDVLVVAEKLNDLDGSAQLQAETISGTMIEVLRANT